MDVDPLLVGIDVMDVLMDEIKSNPTLRYNSRHTAALCIAPEGKGVSTIQIATGYEPPQEFDGNKLTGIDFVKVDGRVVWSRKKPEIEIPF